ncbi:MAG: hydroxyisourate hydrolase [Pseudomonadota bacterium]
MTKAEGFLTTHILDTARGCPASGVVVSLYRLEGDKRTKLAEAVTNSDGRTDKPMLAGNAFESGIYEMVFAMGDYFADLVPASRVPFVDIVPIRFGIDDPNEHYHVPLLASPFSFSTYRGS